jgi:hypothetical protein
MVWFEFEWWVLVLWLLCVVLLGEEDQQSTRASFLIQAPTEENM